MAHVRLITPITDAGVQRSEEELSSIAGSGLRLSLAQIEQGPASIESAYETAFQSLATILRIIDFGGRDGFFVELRWVIDCMADSGLAGAVRAVSYTSYTRAFTDHTMHLASMLGHSLQRSDRSAPASRAPVRNTRGRVRVEGQTGQRTAVDIPVLELEDDIGATQAKLVSVAESRDPRGRGRTRSFSVAPA